MIKRIHHRRGHRHPPAADAVGLALGEHDEAGLVLDGGLTLAAKVQAIDEAQAAARAGAQAIDIPTYRATGQITLDAAQATTDAEDYLAAAGHSGIVTVNGNQVTVTVSITQPMQILSIGGIDHLTVTGTGTATAEQDGGP